MEIRCADHVTPLYPQKLALTSPTGGGRSVGIVRSRTKATEFSLGSRENFLVDSRKNDGVISVKAKPLQAWTGPEGSRRLRLPEFLANRHRKVARLSPLRTGRLYPQETSLILTYIRV